MKGLLTAFTPVLIAGQSLLLAQGTAQITDPEPRNSIEVLVSTDSLRKAAEKGDDEAQTELAKIYFRGTEPAPRDIQGGTELLNKAVQKKESGGAAPIGSLPLRRGWAKQGLPKCHRLLPTRRLKWMWEGLSLHVCHVP